MSTVELVMNYKSDGCLLVLKYFFSAAYLRRRVVVVSDNTNG